MRTSLVIMAAVAAAGTFAGCVDRQMTLVTEPAGAKAYYNDKYVGETPVTFHFTFYAAPRIRLEKDGYETLAATPKLKPASYERFPLDMVSETVIPWTMYDRRTISYTLEPIKPADVPALIQRASELGEETMKQP